MAAALLTTLLGTAGLVVQAEAEAAASDLTLASTSDDGVKGNNVSTRASISADGTKVAFYSFASNLDPADTQPTGDVFVKDLTTGDLTLASTSDDGVKGNGLNSGSVPSLSADGTKVAFQSDATNLDPADTNNFPDVYVKDLTTDDLTLASTSDAGVKGNSFSFEPSLSDDGTKVAFHSFSSNLDPADTDTDLDVFVKDLTTGDVTLASTSDDGVKGNFDSSSPSLSADGTAVAFHSTASNLDPADTDTTEDVYVKDLITGDLTLASTTRDGVIGKLDSSGASLSDDGTKVAFHSFASNLDPADTDATFDVYVKDLTTGGLTLASTSDGGVKGNSHSSSPSLSADGTKVAFDSGASNLDPADTDADGVGDVYVKDLITGDLTLASTSDAGVKGNSHSSYPSLSADMTKVAFDSLASNLDPTDTDTTEDIYVKDLGVTDRDGDGVPDANDNCPTDANDAQTDTDTDGAGDECDLDDDNDGVLDEADAFPHDATESVDTDGDGTGNNADLDDDNDGVLDEADAFPHDASESVDTDGDGTGNNADLDDDGDGISDTAPPNARADCMRNGWRAFNNPTFAKQSDCLKYLRDR